MVENVHGIFRDLGIQPDAGCLTDRIQTVIDSALNLGGTTNLLITDSGMYNFTASRKTTRNGATVLIDTGCYPDGKGGIAEIGIDNCNKL
jgi:hypothetical protein